MLNLQRHQGSGGPRHQGTDIHGSGSVLNPQRTTSEPMGHEATASNLHELAHVSRPAAHERLAGALRAN